MLWTEDGRPRLHWWTNKPNFGDLVSPWLVEKITGKKPEFAERNNTSFISIGSILSHVGPKSVVWGTGSFGTETTKQIEASADYLAVRGPLTRNKLEINNVKCPRVYGDPALLVADYYKPKVEKTHELGIVLRWSESKRNTYDIPGLKKIFLGGNDIEPIIDQIRACKRIASTSLHGLIVADAYGIPNAWIDSATPKGLEFKYWDYLISVDKVRAPQKYRLLDKNISLTRLIDDLNYDGRPISLDLDKLRDSCPF